MWFLLTLIAVAGCSAAGADAETSVAVQSQTEAFRIETTEDLRADVEAAVDLWARATDGAYLPEVVVGQRGRFAVRPVAHIPGAYADTTADSTVRVGADTPASLRVIVIAHELGHTMGLPDTQDDTLMHAAYAAAHPCIQAELTASVGMPGPGACL